MSAVTGTRLPGFGDHVPAPSHRDRSVDLVRAVLLVVVVGLHSMMVGVSIGPEGFLLENALENQPGFAAISWVLQIMPLFFLMGGFSSRTQWVRMRARGHSASDYVGARLRRLLLPAIALCITLAVGFAGAVIAGVPGELIATAGFRISQPLWFLGVYILCSACVPLAVAAQEKAPALSLLGLCAAAIAVDALRWGTGLTGVGFLNLLFVWLAIQQLGFHLASGTFERFSVRQCVMVAVGALLVLAALTLLGPYSPDMYVNLNPPTVCLIVLGIAHLMIFRLAREWLRAVAERPRISRIVDVLGARSMSVYLWHMPVIIGLVAGLLALNALIGLPLPEPLSAGWWGSRPLWLIAVAVAVVPVVALYGRFETRRQVPTALGNGARVRTRAAIGVLLGAGSVLVLLLTGISIMAAIAAAVMSTVALRLTRGETARGVTS